MKRHKWKRPSRPADGIRIAGWTAVMAITAGVFLAAIGASDSEQGALVIGLCLMSGGLLITCGHLDPCRSTTARVRSSNPRRRDGDSMTVKSTLIVAASLMFALSASADIDIAQIELRVTEGFKDPDSATFRNLTTSPVEEDGDQLVCGELNAKNSYGAYTGYQRFSVKKDGGKPLIWNDKFQREVYGSLFEKVFERQWVKCINQLPTEALETEGETEVR